MVVIALPACTSLDKLRDDARGVSFHPCPGQIVAQTRLAAVDIAPDSPIAQQIWDTHPTPDAYWIAQLPVPPQLAPPQLPPLPVMPPPRMIKYVRSFDATLDDDLLPLP
ncbi:uncharacterized protein PAN0_001c0040 [Moesziomyces antarcticus]|uniref:uncharacterized protein n=1 Tax=Pseudozyma antarctica TaxID=84753 RepID=UPI0007197F85|nr:uncharacterized protein PAN0_001c0040 [Moesziomyces antarcticus]GAK61845.1 hypothetical protein PAN0_001c0040 [Moesziomyces antarcticus]